MRGALDALLEEVDYVEPTPALVADAGELAERHLLRAYDAVQLASALALGDPAPGLATWDRDLARAARAEGLAVAA